MAWELNSGGLASLVSLRKRAEGLKSSGNRFISDEQASPTAMFSTSGWVAGEVPSLFRALSPRLGYTVRGIRVYTKCPPYRAFQSVFAHRAQNPLLLCVCVCFVFNCIWLHLRGFNNEVEKRSIVRPDFAHAPPVETVARLAHPPWVQRYCG